jgi:hypothetical protein
MKSFKFILFIFGISLYLGCTKETTIKEEYNPNITIWGTYKATSVINGLDDLKYLKFTTKKTSHTYYMNSSGMRSLGNSSFIPFPDQVLGDFLGFGTVAYGYRFNGDTLIIDYGGTTYFKGIKVNETEVANWVEVVSKTDEISGVFTDRSQGIGFDGTNILLPDYSGSKITKINLSTRLPNGDISVSGAYPNTVEFDGTDLWLGSNGYYRMYKFPLAGGSSTGTAPSHDIGAWIYGIAFDPAGNDLWAYSNNSDTLYQINRTSNTVISRKKISYVRDMAWSNGKLYMVSGPFIYRVKTSSFEIEKTYQLKDPETIYGIAAVGNEFWLNINGNKLIKVSLN